MPSYTIEITLLSTLKYAAYDPKRRISSQGDDGQTVALKHAAKLAGRPKEWMKGQVLSFQPVEPPTSCGTYEIEL